MGAEVGTGDVGDTGDTGDTEILSRPCSNKSCSYLTVSHVLKSDKSWREGELSLESTAPHHPINCWNSTNPQQATRTPTCSNHTTPLEPSWKSRMQGTPRSDSPTQSSYTQQTLIPASGRLRASRLCCICKAFLLWKYDNSLECCVVAKAGRLAGLRGDWREGGSKESSIPRHNHETLAYAHYLTCELMMRKTARRSFAH